MAPGPTCVEEHDALWRPAERTSDMGESRHARLQSIRARRSARLTNQSDDDRIMLSLLQVENNKLDVGRLAHVKWQFAAGPPLPEGKPDSPGDELPHTCIPRKKPLILREVQPVPSEDDPISCRSKLSITESRGSHQRSSIENCHKLEAESQRDPTVHADVPSGGGHVSARRSLLANIKQSRVRRERLSKGQTLDAENIGSHRKDWDMHVEQCEGQPPSQLLWEAHQELSQCATESIGLVNHAEIVRRADSGHHALNPVPPDLKGWPHTEVQCQPTPSQPPKVDEGIEDPAFNLGHIASAAEGRGKPNAAGGTIIITKVTDATPCVSSTQRAEDNNAAGTAAAITCKSRPESNRDCVHSASPIAAQSESGCNRAEPGGAAWQVSVESTSLPRAHHERFSEGQEHEADSLGGGNTISRSRLADLKLSLQTDHTSDQHIESTVSVALAEFVPALGLAHSQGALCEDARLRAERRQARREAFRPPQLQILEEDVACARDTSIDHRMSNHQYSHSISAQGAGNMTAALASVSITTGNIDVGDVSMNGAVDSTSDGCSAINNETLGNVAIASCDLALSSVSDNISTERAAAASAAANHSSQIDSKLRRSSSNCAHKVPDKPTGSIDIGQTSKRRALMDNLKRSRSRRESSNSDSVPVGSRLGGQSIMRTSRLDEYREKCENPTSLNASVECMGLDSLVHESAIHSPTLRQLLSDDSLHAQHRQVPATESQFLRIESLKDHPTSIHCVTSSDTERRNDDRQDRRNRHETCSTSCATRNLRAASTGSLAPNISHMVDTDRVGDRSCSGHGSKEHRTGCVLYATTRNISHNACTEASTKTSTLNNQFSDGAASAAANTLGTAASTANAGADSNTLHNSSKHAYDVSAGITSSKEDPCTVHLPSLAESPRKATDLVVPNLFLDDLKRRWETFQRRGETSVNRAGSFRFRQQVEKKSPPVAQCKDSDSVLPKLS